MPDGPLVPDPVCGRCHKKREMVVRTEAVCQDELGFHTACHRAGAGPLLRATRLAAVLKDVTRGVEIITSPLFSGAEPSGSRGAAGKREPLCRLRLRAGSTACKQWHVCAVKRERWRVVCVHDLLHVRRSPTLTCPQGKGV
jgi:hypothetical protein